MLRLLGDESSFAKINDGSDNESTVEKKGIFKVDEKDLHYVIVALEGDADLGKAKSDVGRSKPDPRDPANTSSFQ